MEDKDLFLTCRHYLCLITSPRIAPMCQIMYLVFFFLFETSKSCISTSAKSYTERVSNPVSKLVSNHVNENLV